MSKHGKPVEIEKDMEAASNSADEVQERATSDGGSGSDGDSHPKLRRHAASI